MDSQDLSVKDLQKKARLDVVKDVQLYNPDSEDFTATYLGKEYTARALEMTTFKLPVARHVKKHLANHIYNKRGKKVNPSHDLIKITEEITT